jgi:NADPH:quinone reductase-like Zn-dependent oxidoreductase
VDTSSLYAKATSVHGLWLTYLAGKRELMEKAWEQLSEWTAQGHLRPVVGQLLPMEKVQEAYKLMIERKNFGKVVLKIG